MADRPRRKRRRPQRLCEELPDSWGAGVEDEDYPVSGPDDDGSGSECDGEYEDEYVEVEEEEEEGEREEFGESTPPNLSPYFRHTTNSHSRSRAHKSATNSEPWWWDRLDVHVAYACAAGSFAILSLVLGLLVVQTGAVDGAYRLGTESTWARGVFDCALGVWQYGFGGGDDEGGEAGGSSWWPSGWSW